MATQTYRIEQHDSVATAMGCFSSAVPKLIFIEGKDGVGKSPFAKELCAKIGGELLHTDDFITPGNSPRAYLQCLRIHDLVAQARSLVSTGRPAMFEGVCLRDVLPRADFGSGFSIYLKRLSFNNPESPRWHYGREVDGPSTSDGHAFHESVLAYHRQHRPHEIADLVLELPEAGHTLRGPARAFA